MHRSALLCTIAQTRIVPKEYGQACVAPSGFLREYVQKGDLQAQSDHMNASTPDAQVWARTLIHSRRTTLPKRLTGPGPDAMQKAAILEAAAAAPDHDQLLPWRFVEVGPGARAALGQAFVAALRERDPQASTDECTQAQEKAERSPWLLLAIVRTAGGPQEIPAHERVLSAGAAIQNMLLMSTAMGLGSALTSGKAIASHPLRELFKLGADEEALCFINIGHIVEQRKPRVRPDVSAYFSTLSSVEA